MRATRLFAVSGVMALLFLGGIEGTHPAWAAFGAKPGRIVPPPHTAPSHRQPVESCVLTADVTGKTKPFPSSNRRVPVESGAAGVGNVVVAVPPVVLIRSAGRRLVVTTNTGKPPRQQDEFYVISPGKAGSASTALKDQVLSECTGRGHR